MQDIVRIIIPIAAIHAVVLAAIIVVVKRLLLSDTVRAVERINQAEADVRQKEEALRREIEERERELAQRKAQAEEELQRQKDQLAKELGEIREKMTADARKESDRILDQARRNEEKLRQQLTQEMEQKAAAYGAQVMGLVFSEKIVAKIDAYFVDELLDALQALDAGSITVDAATAEFTVAHPLAPERKQRLEAILHDKFGANILVEEKLDPALLAGLVMKLGSLEIDGSLVSRFREATEEIKKSAAG
jgi:F0F1-type ATP synthase delta subunit